MALSVHVSATDLPLSARLVYARLATSANTSYTCRQHSRNPAWPTCLIIPPEAQGSVHLALHTQVSATEDGLLGLVAFDSAELRRSAPSVLERKLANGAVVAVRVERVRYTPHNSAFILSASCSRLRRRGAILLDRRVPLVLVVFRLAETSGYSRNTPSEWVPVFRGHGVQQAGSVYFDDAQLDVRTACLGAPARTLRIALYRIDSERKFRLVCFFETAYAALAVLPDGDTVTQPLQGRYYDDQPGLVTFTRTPKDSKTNSNDDDLRISLRFDVFNAEEFVSSYSRPRRGSPSHRFEHEEAVRSRRLFKAPAAADDRVEKTVAFDRPPPSSRSARRTTSRTASPLAGLLRAA